MAVHDHWNAQLERIRDDARIGEMRPQSAFNRRAGRRGVGFRQIPNEYLYETLGLYGIPRRRVDLPRAKV
ncbi:MAG: hypothetical protein WBC87_23475 [Pseudolabrys sp.]